MDTTEQPEDTVGERLRKARLSQKLTLEAIAAQTRIPIRHLEALEIGDWATLPAPAYCVGFAKNYANMVGLDSSTIAADLRAEMGDTRQVYTPAEVFAPADPKRAMPKWLMLGAALAVVLIVAFMLWRRDAALTPAAQEQVATTADPAQPAPTPAPNPTTAPAPPLVAASGQVTITAREDAWIKVRDASGAVLREGILKQGESFAVPATAQGPMLDTGRPESLTISADDREMPPVGVAGRSVSRVSLAPADLARGAPAAATPAPSVRAATPPIAARPSPSAPPTAKPAPQGAATDTPPAPAQ